jgi:hypothetical protein
MKRVLFVISSCCMALSTAHALPTIEWGSTEAWGSNHDVFDRFGNAVGGLSAGSSFLVAMYDAKADGEIDPFGSSDDTLLASLTVQWDVTPFSGGQGYFYAFVPMDDAAGKKVFTRIFDSTTIVTAQFYADFPGMYTFPLSYADPEPSSVKYDIGGVSQSDWKAVPEPGAGMLILVGLGALFARRLRRQV